jgi:hypothetical protein
MNHILSILKVILFLILIFLNINLFIGCSLSNRHLDCYNLNDFRILNTYFQKEDSTFFIVYNTKPESLFYSPGILISSSEKGNGFINVSVLRSEIQSEPKELKYKSTIGWKYSTNNVSLKEKLRYKEYDYIVEIPVEKIIKEQICDQFIEINLLK